jgi:hypothetical protein
MRNRLAQSRNSPSFSSSGPAPPDRELILPLYPSLFNKLLLPLLLHLHHLLLLLAYTLHPCSQQLLALSLPRQLLNAALVLQA